jgi:hypothetical protein
MFGQFLPNKNKMLQCATVVNSESAALKLGQLNTAMVVKMQRKKQAPNTQMVKKIEGPE